MSTTDTQPLRPSEPFGLEASVQRSKGTRAKYRLRGLRIGLAISGVLMIGAAGVIRFVVLPGAAKLPANSNTTNVYAGTAPVLLNTAALAPNSKAPLLLSNVPLQITESVRVLTSSDSDAVVDYRTVQTAGGKPLGVLDYKYGLNRTNLGPGTSLSWPKLVATKGLTVSFPIGTEQRTYTGWVQPTGQTTQVTYAGTASWMMLNNKAYDFGFTANVFQEKTAPTVITDAQYLAMFPSGIPKAQMAQIASQLHLPAATLSKLAAAFPKFPDIVPLQYTYADRYTYWVAPRDGLVVDLKATQTFGVQLPASLLGVTVPIATVAQFSYTDTPATLVARINDARHDAWALNMVGNTMPLVGLILGVVLVAVAAFLRIRRPGGASTAVMVGVPVGDAPASDAASRRAA